LRFDSSFAGALCISVSFFPSSKTAQTAQNVQTAITQQFFQRELQGKHSETYSAPISSLPTSDSGAQKLRRKKKKKKQKKGKRSND